MPENVGSGPAGAAPPLISEEEIARREAHISQIAWLGGLAVTVMGAAVLLPLLVSGGPWWKLAMMAVPAGAPVAYALFCNLVIRRMQWHLFHRYQAQLLRELTGLKEMVYRDELTGLFNRRHFLHVLEAEVARANRSGHPLALLIIDLDGLKTINDEYGHNVGDVVLANLGSVIARQIRSEDVPARLGGDEFGIVMPGTDKRGAFALARRLWAELERIPMYQQEEKALMVTVSIGVAGYPWGGESVEEMMQWADADMYANKVSQKLPREAVAVEPAQGFQDSPLDDFPAGFRG